MSDFLFGFDNFNKLEKLNTQIKSIALAICAVK